VVRAAQPHAEVGPGLPSAARRSAARTTGGPGRPREVPDAEGGASGPPRCLVVGLALLLGALSGCGGPPQIGEDREAFKAVDALYTAVSLREPEGVARCAAGLDELKASGKLSDSASEALAGIIREANEQHWESSQTHLREFMLGQRR
jgi:hypothetical protein